VAENYWHLLYNLFWYRNSVVNEGTHPMLAGFVRLKDRVSWRACFPSGYESTYDQPDNDVNRVLQDFKALPHVRLHMVTPFPHGILV
jgi:hypothetical protein